ncbi:hypothetical protein RYH80_10645 [Halobaculum sp. MBLA0147]|uniref:hypothetical protein n=1 Tax=Halobaculum sp. MBLA0147 TaxID=3079934 RepID=UPI003524C1F7
MNRRRLLQYGLPAVCGLGGVGGLLTTSLRVEAFDFETSYDRPQFPWALCVVDGRDPDHPNEERPAETTPVSSFAPAVDRRLRSAAADGDTGFEREPTRLRAALSDVTWVDGFADGEVRAFAVVPTGADGPPPVAVEATRSGDAAAPASPVTFGLTARNRSERTVVVHAGPRPPFGAVWLDEVDGTTGDGFPLFPPDELLAHAPWLSHAVTTPGTNERYEPGDATTRRYQLRATEEAAEPGRYEATGSFGFGTLVPPGPDEGDIQVASSPSVGTWSVEWTATVELGRPW